MPQDLITSSSAQAEPPFRDTDVRSATAPGTIGAGEPPCSLPGHLDSLAWVKVWPGLYLVFSDGRYAEWSATPFVAAGTGRALVTPAKIRLVSISPMRRGPRPQISPNWSCW